MTRILDLFLVLFFTSLSISLAAQLPDGSIAPDFTLTDINGDTYNLYDELEAGRSIVLDISATWCGPCWTYHEGGTLDKLYENFGPDGTNEIRVFMVEGDDATNLSCLYGPTDCNNTTLGDWVSDTAYPIFSPELGAADSLIEDYKLRYWPSIYGISPIDKTTFLIGQSGYEFWKEWVIDSWQMKGTTSITDADCMNGGMVDLEITHGFGNLSYEWSNGSTLQDLTNVSAGTYSVIIKDEHDVSITIDSIVVGGILSLMELDNQSVDCNGESTGAIEVIVSGGEGTIEYDWSNGLQGSYIDNLSQGEYEVTCTDINGCVVVQSFTISEPEAISIISIVITEDIDALSSGTISLEAAGGTGDLMFEWSNGATTSNIDNLPAGEYSVIITDANGCIYTETGIIVGATTDVTDIDVVVDFSMYPVPAQTILNINAKLNTSQTIKMDILDTTGNLVWSKSYQTAEINEKVDLASFPTGIYILAVASSGSIQSEKFIVIK